MSFGLIWPACWADSLDLGPGHAEKAWHEMRKVLGVVRTHTSELDVKLAVAFVPARVQYVPEHLELLRGFGYHVVDSWAKADSRFQVALARWCGARDIPFIDVTAAFRSHPSRAKLSTTYEGRLTADGHRLVAGQLEPWLRRLLSR
jgi:hypothetical protein